ncbi:MAG: amidohydrolase family protein, partial [Deinococcota bacterium]
MSSSTRFHGTFIFPETAIHHYGTLHVNNGRIVSFEAKDASLPTPKVQASSNDIFLEGYVTPGLTDAHVHLCMDGSARPESCLQQGMVHLVATGLHSLKRQLAAGITTVRDLGSPHNLAIDLATAVNNGVVRGPNIVSCGHNITMTGGHGHNFGREADGVDGVRWAAREELKQGAQVLKFMATGGVITKGVQAGAEAYTEAEMRAGSHEAHKKGKHTAAHAQGLTGILNALRAGIDTIEHGAFDHWNDESLDLLRTRFLVPTLAAPEGIVTGGSEIPEWIVAKTSPIVDAHRSNIHEAWQADVPIVAGSDAGTPMNPHGRLIR